MDRKEFLASLPFLPSAVKAVLERKPERRRIVIDEAMDIPWNPADYVGEWKWTYVENSNGQA